MSDSNVPITAGAGTLVDSDLIGGEHIQFTKPTWGPIGTRNVIDTPTPLPTQVVPSTAGGLSVYQLISAAGTNAVNIKASAGQVYGWSIMNPSSSTRYFKLFNKASAPTVGTDSPVMTFALPGNGGIAQSINQGIVFATGIAACTTTGSPLLDTGAVGLSDVIVNLYYK